MNTYSPSGAQEQMKYAIKKSFTTSLVEAEDCQATLLSVLNQSTEVE